MPANLRSPAVLRGLSGVLFGLSVVLAGSFAGAGDSQRVVTGIDALRAEIGVAPAAARDVLLFSPDDHLADLFLPLRRENWVDSFVLVVPSESPISDENVAAWKDYAGTLSPGADNAFILRDGGLEGMIEGLSVRIAGIRDWQRGPGRGPVILDLAFLVAMYKDEVRTPFVDLPRKFMATLEDRKVDPSRLRLWIADRAGIPLAWGYLPRLAEEVARNPSAFRGEIPAKWNALRHGEYLAFFGAHEEAAARFEEYLKDAPEDPAVLFRLAQLGFLDREIERGLGFLRRACKADAYYVRGYAESALRFFRRAEFEDAERIVRAGLLIEPSSLELKEGLAHALLGQAKVLLSGDAALAEARFSEIAALGLPEDVLAEIRRQWSEAKSAPPASVRPPAGMPPAHPKF